MNIRSIKSFVEEIENKHKIPCYRKIQVNLVNGRKKPIGEKNDLTPEQIKQNRGSGNTFSISIKHIPDLYCIDFDEKDVCCELYDLLNEDCVATTETKKGSHYYCYIRNLPKYKQQQKILNEEVDCDLIKINNMWETDDRMINGDIKEYEWNDLKDYFNIPKMNFINSPVVSPVNSPIQSEEEADDHNGWVHIKEEPVLSVCDTEEFKKHINSFKPRYDYDDWIRVGFICFNNFKGEKEGFKFWKDYSKEDDNYEGTKKMLENWNYWIKKPKEKKLITYKQFIRWRNIDYPPSNKYEGWFQNGEDYFMEEMNKECMYYTLTGDILYFSRNMYIRNKPAICKQYYKKYSFVSEADEKEVKTTNPFDLWFGHIHRKDIDKIVFNPKGESEIDEFNIWKGFKIQPKNEGDPEKIKPFLDHIKHIWADDNEDTYNYILNWFSRLLQQPWKKNNICLVLHSIEGVGKSFILDMIGKIIGNDYYISTSNLKNILGEFNGDAEGKILVNLNETGMWYDKKVVGSFKEFITDSTISINKKGVQQYTIENYCNTIMTTNEDHIVNIDGNDRRFNILECKNVKYEKDYYKNIAQTNIQDIADYLYSRDITNYDSRDFKKSELHLQQVKKNMCSVELFYTEYLEGDIMGNGHDIKNPWFDKYEEEPVRAISKEHIFQLYNTRKMGSHDSKVNNRAFWIKMKKLCPSMNIGKANKTSKAKITFPKKEIADEEYSKYFGL
tara:strand:+ start:5998 stop:8178 length:2181 start_codon:yes stop_codon:yes gene_type:complete